MGGFDIIEDVESERKLIETTIKRYGCDPEQNYGYFLAHHTNGDRCVFVKNGKYGIQATFDEKAKSWVMIGAPIAPKDKQVELLEQALSYLSGKRKLDKFVAEFDTERKKQADSVIGKKFKVYTPSCVLYWPVYNMKTWTGNKLRGKTWKKVRNMLNNLKRNHRIKVADAGSADKDKLKDVIRKWVRIRNQTGFGINRKDSNRTDYDHYLKLVDMEFTGCDFAKTVMVNGNPASITAGWEIPNSDGCYYSGIGVYDLSVQNLGVFTNWNDLVNLKKAGYRQVDFGGSPKPLLQFKRKFKPESIYRTHIFTIGRKK